MDDNKRILLAFVLAFLILFLWRGFLVKTPPPKPPETAPATTQKGSSPAPKAVVPPAAEKAERVALPVEEGANAQEITVDGPLYSVTLATRGGVIKSWILKRYRDAQEHPLDVVNVAACKELGFPMSLNLADQAESEKLNQALYISSTSSPTLQAPAQVKLTYSDGRYRVQKTFSFETGYQIHVQIEVSDSTGKVPVAVRWPGGFGDTSLPPSAVSSQSKAFYGAPGDFTTVKESKVKEERIATGAVSAAGLEDLYFVGVFLPDSPDDSFHIIRQQWNPANWKEKEPPKPLEVTLGTTEAKPLGFRLFVAPKDLDVLRAAHPPLDGLVDFGWFSFIAKPLFLALRYIYEHGVHNWGWAIVILTVVLNFALFPLKLKSIRSAQEMQKVQPIIKGIQEKYKQYKATDPRKQRMNQEVMKVYQEHHINPLGGCLPMALQLPILYGFYELLEVAIELRHAPWIWCVKDLSLPDTCHLFGIPLAILPTVMIIATFIQQKLTPTPTADPNQQRMMMFMPLFIGIIFYRLAAGLVLYYLAASVVGIAQQLIINRFMPLPQKAPAAPVGGRSKQQPAKPVGVKE